MGYRFRLHRADIRGKPDLAFIGRRKVIFVHGCFWHGHHCARGARQPKTNSEYWQTKISRNAHRDRRNLQELQSAGWQVLTVWECETPIGKRDALQRKLGSFLR
jgi:DNA mismatch endonuclease (patch repair protein)